ncbi:hypothetical protein Cadr_000008897 [Camelus dromedarius]|uniref:Uncharacterized protein n=1 Tax=Camelus dromedarius TaxID=9838 RepID=A0A5N4DIN3_CAMDR|nr:hypothetical protein Cadr_000008897 [Camelus dromedarius]
MFDSLLFEDSAALTLCFLRIQEYSELEEEMDDEMKESNDHLNLLSGPPEVLQVKPSEYEHILVVYKVK